MSISFYRYVNHHRAAAYQAAGWRVCGRLHVTRHGQWSVLMRWTGAGDPVEPAAEAST